MAALPQAVGDQAAHEKVVFDNENKERGNFFGHKLT
jgi:hypothetical protein